MSMALPLTNYISQGATRKRTNRVLSARFGDGYSQEAPDGTNYKYDEWSLSFENLTTTDRATMWAALDAVGGWDYFTWTPPGGVAAKWKVTSDGVQERPVSGDMYSLSFTLRQIF
jgi:phage-related protein